MTAIHAASPHRAGTAVNATSAGGEIDALDPAGYGPIIIGQAITIEGQGRSYVAPPVGGNGITINAVSGNVTVHGVSLNGVGLLGSTTGIAFNSGGSLNVKDCGIRNFVGNGISFIISASSPSQLFVSNTLISDNTGDGIGINSSGKGTTNGVLVEMLNSDRIAGSHSATRRANRWMVNCRRP